MAKIKDFFYRLKPYKVVSSASLDTLGNNIESADYIESYAELENRFVPDVDFSTASNFARFGSAEEYYSKSIESIYKTYPYDGSLHEKNRWHVSASHLDNWIFKNKYPRVNGYVTLGNSWSSVSATRTDGSEQYKVATSPQYISVLGGPHGPSKQTHDHDNKNTLSPSETNWKDDRNRANVWDTGSNRSTNLLVDGTKGNTVEFWFKSTDNFANDASQLSPSFNVGYFDLHNGNSIGAANYGRLLIESRRTAQNTFVDSKLFHVSYMSGTSGFNRVGIGDSSLATTSTFASWNHFAFTFTNGTVKFYMNGELQETSTANSDTLGEIEAGSMNAYIGAYKHPPSSDASTAGVVAGDGAVSGSFDEFRFWKTVRNSEQIYRYYKTQVGGGTNTDDANTHLGVYYKFNEGITGNSTTDSRILDYSGRVSNGSISNYDADTSEMRNVNSAMVEASASNSEFKDPILYPWHDDVSSVKSDLLAKGREWDYRNASYLYNSFPAWIVEEDLEKDKKGLLALTQIISSYFDSLYLQMESLPGLRDITYNTGSSGKAHLYADKLLGSRGLIVPEIFADATVLERLASRDNDREYTENLYDIKNTIYKNIYNNLSHINKSKGTEKSIRNLIRCFGVDDELYKLNIYSDNATLTPHDNIRLTTVRKNYVDFDFNERFNATVYQYTSSLSPTNSYLSASHNATDGYDSEISVTFECEAIFAKKPPMGQKYHEKRNLNELTSSIFGAHTARFDDMGTNYTWNDMGILTAATSADAVDMDGYFAAGDPKLKFNLQVPVAAGGSNTQIIIRPDISKGSSPASAGSNYITIGIQSLSDTSTAALIAKAINGTTDSRITYGNASGDGSAGTGVQGVTATSSGTKVTFTMATGGTAGNVSDVISFGPDGGTVNIVDVNDFTGGIDGDYDFQVYAVRDQTYGIDSNDSPNVYFKLKSYESSGNSSRESSTDYMPTLTSDLFEDVYSNQKWNFAVRIKPTKYPNVGFVSGSGGDDDDAKDDGGYTLDFIGISAEMDHIVNEFKVSTTLTDTQARRIITSPKRMFVGAHRTNFTGNVLHKSDARISSLRAWMIGLTDEEIRAHAYDAHNYGVFNPHESAYLMETSGSLQSRVPKIETLALHWDFANVTGSDDSGMFTVQDASSGSADVRYGQTGTLGAVLKTHHDGRGEFFNASSTDVISREYVYTAKQNLPENLSSLNMIEIREEDDLTFTRDTRPINYVYSLEKSMYQTISEEMMNFFAGSHIASGSIDNLIGEPVNRYRQKYKDLERLRALFFERVSNIPDFDKYTDYFSWLDESVSMLVEPLIPASLDFKNVSNVVESHIFERNKYWNKFPTLEMKHDEPSGSIKGVNELLYNWRYGHAPLNPSNGRTGGDSNENTNCLWWKEKARRDHHPLDSGDPSVDNSRGLLHSASIQAFDRRFASPKHFDASIVEVNSVNQTNATTAWNKFDTTQRLLIKSADVESSDLCNSKIEVELSGAYSYKKEKLSFHSSFDLSDKAGTFLEGKNDYFKRIAPFSIYSSSVDSLTTTNFKDGIELTNIHSDTTMGTNDIPLQGPFTQTHVGGMQHRHVDLNLKSGSSVDNSRPYVRNLDEDRPEAWRIKQGSSTLSIYGPHINASGVQDLHLPRATYYRDEFAKRMLNIRNIKHNTGSVVLGNYDKDYQVVQAFGRNVNNSYLVDSGSTGIVSDKVETRFISGVLDYTLPERPRREHTMVERFSAPGGPEVMSRGFLDVESETYSVYNAMPWRNLSVRKPLLTFLSKSCGQFGINDGTVSQSEDWAGTRGDENADAPRASFHKINRNGQRRIEFSGIIEDVYTDNEGNPQNEPYVTGTVYDNWFVQHPIPASERQYAWITASALTTPFGYSQRDAANASLASTDITFVQNSDYGISNSWTSWGKTEALLTDGIFTYFVGLNTMIYEPISSSVNTLGYPQGKDIHRYVNVGDPGEGHAGTPIEQGGLVPKTLVSTLYDSVPSLGQHYLIASSSILNAILLHRNGPYQHPTWKQIRTGEHPVARHMKKNNRYSILQEKIKFNTATSNPIYIGNKKSFILSSYVEDVLHSFTEPPMTSKYKPMQHAFKLVNGDAMSIDHSYANQMSSFANSGKNGINDLLGLKTKRNKTLVYDALKEIYVENILGDQSPILELLDVEYKEVIYPKEVNTFLAKTRGRTSYSETLADMSSKKLGTQRTIWRDDFAKRTRTEGTAINSQNITIINDHLVGWPSGSVYPSTDLSIWPLDTGDENGSTAPIPGTSPYFIRRSEAGGDNDGVWVGYATSSLGELSHFSDWTIHLANFAPTASLSFHHYQLVGVHGYFNGDGLDTSADSGLQKYPHWIHFAPKYRVSEQSSGSFAGTGETWTGRKPWFDSYEDFADDIRYMAKDYTIIPEFRISEHMDHYLQNGFDHTEPNYKAFTLEGADTANSEDESRGIKIYNTDFIKTYSHSDFVKFFSFNVADHSTLPSDITNVENASDATGQPISLSLTCNGIMKLLPYNGFYPVTRTVQLGTLFSQSYGPSLTGKNYSLSGGDDTENYEGARRLQTALQPFFAPGIMYNTVKSGVGVDWPVFFSKEFDPSDLPTDFSYNSNPLSALKNAHKFTLDSATAFSAFTPTDTDGDSDNEQVPLSTDTFLSNFLRGKLEDGGDGVITGLEHSYRLPFEALIEPDQYLIKSGSLSVRWSSSSNKKTDNKYFHIQTGYPIYPTSSFWGGAVSGSYKSSGGTVTTREDEVHFEWMGESQPNYTLAMHNFVAEIPKFFLKEEKLNSFESKPASEFKPFTSGTVYFMDVLLRKTEDMVMFEGPSQYQIPLNSGRAFAQDDDRSGKKWSARGWGYGPSCQVINYSVDSDTTTFGMEPSWVYNSTDPSYAPYTPPYFYGTSVARVAFSPHKVRRMDTEEAGTFTLDEIFGQAEVETLYFNHNERAESLPNSSGDVTNLLNLRNVANLGQTQGLNTYGNLAAKSQMHVSSSVNLFSRVRKSKPTVDENGLVISQEIGTEEQDRWVISTKFETPVMNFSGSENPKRRTGTVGSITTDENATFFKSKGMWYNYGELLENSSDTGIWFELRDSYPDLLGQKTSLRDLGLRESSYQINKNWAPTVAEGDDESFKIGSLKNHVGFGNKYDSRSSGGDLNKKRVGQLANQKVISEAIVAIPLAVIDGKNAQYVPIPKDWVNLQRDNLVNHGMALKEGDVYVGSDSKYDTSISNMMKMMQKYVIPPEMDFLHHDDLDPFVMYIMEFEHTLSKQDLANIWQGILPDIGVRAEKNSSTIMHPLNQAHEFFGQYNMEANNCDIEILRWQVFKVKRRASTNYYSLTPQTEIAGFDALNRNKNFQSLISKFSPAGVEKELHYSYNWPYDFFSLIELVQIEAEMHVKPIVTAPEGSGKVKVPKVFEQFKKPLVLPAEMQKMQITSTPMSLAASKMFTGKTKATTANAFTAASKAFGTGGTNTNTLGAASKALSGGTFGGGTY